MSGLIICSAKSRYVRNHVKWANPVVRRALENPHAGMGMDISPMPVRHGQTPARRLWPAGKRMLWRAGRGFVVRPCFVGVEVTRLII
jgi:hypothetical protein